MSVMNYKAIEIARLEIGNRPVEGARTWGPAMEKYLKTVGLNRGGGGYDYCAAFINYCFREACFLLGRDNPLDVYSVDRQRHISRAPTGLYRYGKDMGLLVDSPQTGDIFITSEKHHAGLVDVTPAEGSATMITVEGNTYIGDHDWGVHRRTGKKIAGNFFLRLR